MGGTYKKKQRAEKAKVKLKGAKLAKGLNVTKTEFKVRKIQIREQLKESQYLNGQRQINLKESLSRLKHHSSNYRMEALRNIREAITSRHVGLVSHLNELIQNISAICLDVDKETRRESFRTLNSLFETISSAAIAPFFHIISSYLRCAMTHIQSAIQEDALLMLDVLLQHVPELIAMHSDKILKNFLEMISRVRAEGDRAGRILTMHMGQKQTTIKWRLKVLLRLQQMLQTQIQFMQKHKKIDGNRNVAPNFQSRVFSTKEPQHYSIKLSYYAQNSCDFATMFSRTPNEMGKLASHVIITDESQQLQGYIKHLMPLLSDAWLEVRPQMPTDGTQIILPEESAHTLKIVLDIMGNLWSLVDSQDAEENNQNLNKWFRQQYAEAFSNNFLQATFPYYQVDNAGTTSKKKQKKPLNAADQRCFHQNVHIAYLMCRFYPNNIANEAMKFQAILDYLQAVVENSKIYYNGDQLHLALTLQAIFVDSSLQFLQLDKTKALTLLRSTIKVYMSNQFPNTNGVSVKILSLLCAIVQSPSLLAAYGSQEFNEFLSFLPQLLLKPAITEATLVSLSTLGKQKNSLFLNELQVIIEAVIEHLPKLQVTGAANAFEGKKYVMNLFYWADVQWSAEQRDELLKKIETHISDKRIVDYFKFVLKQK